jgi:hypothetical protein
MTHFHPRSWLDVVPLKLAEPPRAATISAAAPTPAIRRSARQRVTMTAEVVAEPIAEASGAASPDAAAGIRWPDKRPFTQSARQGRQRSDADLPPIPP